jgi:TRAP-type C4-dicarboxylate transport system permease small subunit
VDRFIAAVERTAGAFLGLVAAITFAEAVLRYSVAAHIPDGFILGQMLQGIAICWGIATATYADRHVVVDALYTVVTPLWQRIFDVAAYTLNLAFFAAFGFMITFKVYDILKAGERSIDLNLPIWAGYLLASVGIVVTLVLAAARWWQVVWMRKPPSR